MSTRARAVGLGLCGSLVEDLKGIHRCDLDEGGGGGSVSRGKE